MMTPAPGERLQKFVGDCVRFHLKIPGGAAATEGWHARLRTNLGRAELLRREILDAHTNSLPIAGASWRDLPMASVEDGWVIELAAAEVGYFQAKAYLLDPQGWQHWPEGGDVGISVHPDSYRTGNILYCAFPRLFGPTRNAVSTANEKLESQIQQIEEHGFAILPPSGKLRDLVHALPHIIDVLGCRILHLLPVNPTPTTYARFGRFGSPYAALDLTAIDPALVVFDKRTTAVDQFRELTYATHERGGRVFIDIVINHTGWGSTLQENNPEWFLRDAGGTFASPGAWGVTWEDLVELKHDNVALWDRLAAMFLTWCRRGVDGFRCDAGYKVPLPAWQYIIARVQQEFPETLFLLEGLGGSWETTESLLTEGRMQWAYSELFQNYSGREVATYLDYALRQSARVGLYVHYSETHDNNRLAAHGRGSITSATPPDKTWSWLRNGLCGLTSVSGGFGFTCGVEWLATEKIRVHGCNGLAWGRTENLVKELAQLNRLLSDHPCFFDGGTLARLSEIESPVYALLRKSGQGDDAVLVLANTDPDKEQTIELRTTSAPLEQFRFELLGQAIHPLETSGNHFRMTLAPGQVCCLAPAPEPLGLRGDVYRAHRGRAAWAIQALHHTLPSVAAVGCDWLELSRIVDRSPFAFLARTAGLTLDATAAEVRDVISGRSDALSYPRVIQWSVLDCNRVTPVPPAHWLLIEDDCRFRASLLFQDEGAHVPQHVEAIAAGGRFIACFPPRGRVGDARLVLERYGQSERSAEGRVRFVPADPRSGGQARILPGGDAMVLLTNGIGGMARLCVDLGRIQSKYDCVLGANLHARLPVDRHIFAKRIRAWVVADGFISPLNSQQLVAFESGPPAVWKFVANAGDGRTVEIEVHAAMVPGRNSTIFRFSRPTAAAASGKQLPADADVRLTVRVDIEDRNFHSETRRNGGTDFHFQSNVHLIDPSTHRQGFAFTPAQDRQLRVFAKSGRYHSQPEWSEGIPHPVEAARGQIGSGDAFSPGWFEFPMPKGGVSEVCVTAEPEGWDSFDAVLDADGNRAEESFATRLESAARTFVVRRDEGKTVIAGYPWFLDWGRDTFICARGLITAGMLQEVEQIVLTFARFEQQGTLPNTIHGADASNRDTSDAPLWFGVVCEELAQAQGQDALYDRHVDDSGRTIRQVLRSIADNYVSGTPNGIGMDPESGLIWSPSHFTWMDTNYPAGTPREGYPVEIQALWIRLLRHLARISPGKDAEGWARMAEHAKTSVEQYCWLEDRGWYADVLIAARQVSAARAVASDALRSNALFLVSLGVISGERARRCVAASQRYLVIPGALRSLAPLPVSVPVPVLGNHGGMLNDPLHPYWGHYEGDEDTRRKPAYHNGTAWTWTFPVFCEALAAAWEFAPEAVAAARAYLASIARLMESGCLGHVPEVLDGNTPHAARGCDAQAWGATEALRVWRILNS
ncbi:MAG TPA: amylo-alpha-1,6-glucosidase [Verrucomicrobiae bacterium]|nr:amylo-alpha-1,6-glucosidase [Verrucomicrobiae bacterium]